MMENGKRTKRMVKAPFVILMVTLTPVAGSITKQMDLVVEVVAVGLEGAEDFEVASVSQGKHRCP